jgi:hypothetical protein
MESCSEFHWESCDHLRFLQFLLIIATAILYDGIFHGKFYLFLFMSAVATIAAAAE